MTVELLEAADIPFSRPEHDAWAPLEPLTVSQWAARYRILSREESHQPGNWRNDVAPYLVGIMDLMGDESLRELAVQKAGQVGVSQAARNWIAYCVVREPAPFCFTMPDDKSGREQIEQYFIPMLENTPALFALVSERLHDTKLSSVKFSNGCWVKMAYA